MRFSIIIPTFNAEKTLSSALESIVAQKYPDYEVLILDGQSNDGTETIANRFSQTSKRIKWISEKDDGIYDAMNKGIKNSVGEWIFFLGSDDSLADDTVLSRVSEFISRQKNVDMVYGNVQLTKPIGYNNADLVYDGFFTADKLLRKNICHQAIFYHKSLFQTFGHFRIRYKIFADYDFNLRCFNKVKALHLDMIIAHFNTEGSSNNQQDADRFFEQDFLENMALHYSYNFRHPFFTGRKRELASLMKRRAKALDLKSQFHILPILAYQFLRRTSAKAETPVRQTP